MNLKAIRVIENSDNKKIDLKSQLNPSSVEDDKISDMSDETIKKMSKIILICFLFLIAELIGGILANSLAILSDAAHLSSDLSGFIISLFSLYIGRRKPNSKYTFGFYRAEVIGALASVITIWILTGILLKEAIDRLINPSEINAGVMLITSIFGLICNLAMFKVLHNGHHHDCGYHHHGCSDSNKHDNILNIIDDFKDSLENSKENSEIIEEDSSSHITILDNEEEDKTKQNKITNKYKNSNISDKNSCKHKHKNSSHKHKCKHDKNYKLHKHTSYRNYHQIINSHNHGHHHIDEDNSNDLIHKHEDNVNIKAALIHIIGDIIQSVGVVIAAFIIYVWPDWKIFDPICTFIFSIIVLFTTYSVTRQCICILMEATPKNLDSISIKEAILKKKFSQINSLHSIHIWTLSTGKNCISFHIVIDKNTNNKLLLVDLTNFLKNVHKFHTTMIQNETIEEYKILNCSI